jgi:AbrB family looped-hinge helix DNA binding protein
MDSTTLSSKGQIVIPKALRDTQHWLPGTVFSVKAVAGTLMLKPLAATQPSRISDVAGCLKAPPSAKHRRARLTDEGALRRRALREDEASKA